MSDALTWTGLDQLFEALRTLPEDVTGEATPIVLGAASDTKVEVETAYQAHSKTGNLASHVVMEVRNAGEYGAWAVVRSRAHHAYLFEVGTVPRHYITAHGVTHNTGSMPPAHLFVPSAIRHRRAMYVALAEMLRRHGAVVTGV